MAHARLTLTPLVALLALLAGACGPRSNGRDAGGSNPISGWASVPACQTAVRARAFSEFGYKSRVAFQGIADEKRITRGRIRVSGTAIIERDEDRIDIEYECLTSPKNNRLISATYRAPKATRVGGSTVFADEVDTSEGEKDN